MPVEPTKDSSMATPPPSATAARELAVEILRRVLDAWLATHERRDDGDYSEVDAELRRAMWEAARFFANSNPDKDTP